MLIFIKGFNFNCFSRKKFSFWGLKECCLELFALFPDMCIAFLNMVLLA